MPKHLWYYLPLFQWPLSRWTWVDQLLLNFCPTVVRIEKRYFQLYVLKHWKNQKPVACTILSSSPVILLTERMLLPVCHAGTIIVICGNSNEIQVPSNSSATFLRKMYKWLDCWMLCLSRMFFLISSVRALKMSVSNWLFAHYMSWGMQSLLCVTR